MMELKKFVIDGKEIEFVNSYHKTRDGFAHNTSLFIDNYCYGEAACHYLNRTWEYYEYQTVMIKVIKKLMDSRAEWLKNNFKTEHGYTRLTTTRQAEFIDLRNSDPQFALYLKILEELERY